ncbi:MAG: hypothetical protein ACXWWI_04865, partial [Nitrospira sp.]
VFRTELNSIWQLLDSGGLTLSDGVSKGNTDGCVPVKKARCDLTGASQPVPFTPWQLIHFFLALNTALVSAIIPAALEKIYGHYHY